MAAEYVDTLSNTIVVSVFNGIAVTSTFFRLIHRTVKQRLWWDEFWALVSLIFITCQWVACVNIPEPGTEMSRLWRISYQVLYNVSLWTARISLAVTIVRICPEGKLRKVAKWIAAGFGFCCVCLTVRRTIRCALVGGLATLCPFDTPSGAVETTLDILADAWLIGVPIFMVCRMRLPSRHLRMLVVIFMLNILTTIACVVHAVFRQLQMSSLAITTSNVQSATSLFVCNLLVLVTFLYRKVRGGGEATSISDKTETVTHSVPQPRPSARSFISLRHRLPPGARIEMTTISAGSCPGCALCKYLHERLQVSPARRWSTSSLRIPLPRIDSKVALGKDPGRVPSEKSLSELFPCNCHLSPSSTFPELPACELHKNRNPRRVPTEKSITSLFPCMCNLSPSSTFPDLPACSEQCHRRRERKKKEKESSEQVPSSPLPSLLSTSIYLSLADGNLSSVVRSEPRPSKTQITIDSGNNGDNAIKDSIKQTDSQSDPVECTERSSRPLENSAAEDLSREDSRSPLPPENAPLNEALFESNAQHSIQKTSNPV